MSHPHTLFEVSWEVCNKVGGIHTVVSTKAKTLVERFGDDYVAIGPWLLSNPQADESFEESPGFEAFTEACRELGVPVRVGRWKIPGSPRTILVEFSGLFERKDGVLAGLWERYQVDSISGEWDYIEPLMFGHAAGLVIERWWQEFCEPLHKGAVAQFHEWMTGSGLLHLEHAAPAVGLVFTTHATMLGRSLAGTGRSPEDGLEGRSPAEQAKDLGIVAKHSMEEACAREADVFTTVSEITGAEATAFLGRQPDPLLPNGIDLDVIDELRAGATREQARSALVDLTRRVLGEDLSEAALLCLSGRYEFHNKGIDLLLEAAARIEKQPGRPLVVFLMVPAGHTGIRAPLAERLARPIDPEWVPLDSSTHNLIDPENDPIQQALARLELANERGARVKVLQIPIYLHAKDGLLGLSYEAVLSGMDLTAFPSFYEPWGYTPEESLAVGVPTITTDHAGFGRWARGEGLGVADGVQVLQRVGVDDEAAAGDLANAIEIFLAESLGSAGLFDVCRNTARRTAWSDLISNYLTAFERALEGARERAKGLPQRWRRPQVAVQVATAADAGRPRLFAFDVSATLPEALRGLERLAGNYYWSWDPEGPALFEDLSPASWKSCGHDPMLFLRVIFPEDLEARGADQAYVARLERVLARFEAYLATPADAAGGTAGESLSPARPVAYFSAEFGLHESLRVYSGGLGILAGDHLKSASDLNLPLVGIGLFYRKGYMRQQLSPAGEQIALDTDNDPRRLPIELVRHPDGHALEVSVELPSRRLVLRAWRVSVGRVPLYLLDAGLDSNRPEDRAITAHLYGGDEEMRLRQEIALGRGGVRLLAALGIEPGVFHINEGHAAFLAIERTGRLVADQGLTFDEARELVRATTVFTTHTPVPAGHDRFGEDLIRRYFSDAPAWIGVSWDRFYGLGRTEGDDGSFNMTYLAMNFAGFVNGVSKLHGEVSRDLLHPFFPRMIKAEVPVDAVTNGIHLPTWTHPRIGALLGAEQRPVRGEDFRERAGTIDDHALWQARRAARSSLMQAARSGLERSFIERHDSPRILTRMLEGLDEKALLIGFARRFAPYKRANLLFQDIERLERLLKDEQRPLRIFYAGKAHPKDTHGQEILKQIAELCRQEPWIGRVFFLEDYDIELARALIQGVDVWLNNPIRTLEASGTSGMKAAANGVLNLSVPDGWWVEGYDGRNGWSIGDEKVYQDQELQNELDGATLVRLIDEELLPTFFERDAEGLPRAWLERMRHCLATIPPVFDTDRMVGEYASRAYRPMAERGGRLAADGRVALQELVQRHQRIRKAFGKVEILDATLSDLAGLKVGDPIEVRVEVGTGGLSSDELLVEMVLGHTREEANLHRVHLVPLTPVGDGGNGGEDGQRRAFTGSHKLHRSGSFAYGIRVRVRLRDALDQGLRDLAVWA